MPQERCPECFMSASTICSDCQFGIGPSICSNALESQRMLLYSKFKRSLQEQINDLQEEIKMIKAVQHRGEMP